MDLFIITADNSYLILMRIGSFKNFYYDFFIFILN